MLIDPCICLLLPGKQVTGARKNIQQPLADVNLSQGQIIICVFDHT